MEKTSNKLVDLSVAFAVEILNLVKYLKSQHETIICNQIGRAGTSVGANIHEAQYAHGKADFVSKRQIALKEANETSFWLLLLNKSNIIPTAEYEPAGKSLSGNQDNFDCICQYSERNGKSIKCCLPVCFSA